MKVAAWVVGALAVGAALRFPFLANQSFSYEETFTVAVLAQDSLADMWRQIQATESTPPLSYLSAWGVTEVLGTRSEAAVRAAAAIAGVLSVPATFFALRRMCGERVAIAAAWLCATSPLLVAYAFYGRSYSFLVLTSILSVWALGALIERPSHKRGALWALSGAACLWTHYFAAFLFLAEAGVLMWRLPERRRELAGWSLAVGVTALPLLTLVLDQRDSRTEFIGERSLGGRLEDGVRELSLGANVPVALLEGAGILLAVGGTVAGVVLARRRGMEFPALGALAAVAGGLPLALALTSIDDHFLLRNLLGAWVAFAAFLALGLSALRAVPLVLYSVLCAVTTVAIQADWRYQEADWKGATGALEARAHGSPIVSVPGLQAPVAALYLGRRPADMPVVTDKAWAIVEPARRGDRELEPVDDLQPGVLPGPPFREVGESRYRGFRLIELRAPEPTPINPGEFGIDRDAGQPRATLLPQAGF